MLLYGGSFSSATATLKCPPPLLNLGWSFSSASFPRLFPCCQVDALQTPDPCHLSLQVFFPFSVNVPANGTAIHLFSQGRNYLSLCILPFYLPRLLFSKSSQIPGLTHWLTNSAWNLWALLHCDELAFDSFCFSVDNCLGLQDSNCYPGVCHIHCELSNVQTQRCRLSWLKSCRASAVTWKGCINIILTVWFLHSHCPMLQNTLSQ